jgi:hypothetical protein
MASTPSRAPDGDEEGDVPGDVAGNAAGAATGTTTITGGSMIRVGCIRVDTPTAVGGFWVEVAVMVAMVAGAPS